MYGQVFIHSFVLEQHVPNILSIFFIFQNLIQGTRLLSDYEIFLVSFMGIAT